MKNLSLILVLLVSTSFAFAKSSKKISQTNKTNFDLRVPVKNWIKKMNDGFRFGVAVGTLDMNSKQRQPGYERSMSESGNSKIQLNIGYEKINLKDIGYSAFATYQDVSIDEAIYDADLRNMRLSGNVTYGLTKQAYTYGGLNWGKWYGSEEVESKIDSGIGFQAGLGLKMHKKVNLEIEYLSLSNEGKVNDLNINLEAKGIMLKLNTPFSFNI